MEITSHVKENGDLVVKVDRETREELLERYARSTQGWWSLVADLFESESCNGGLTPFEPGNGEDSPFVGLTDSLCIAQEGAYPDDSGKWQVHGRLWVDSKGWRVNLLDALILDGEYTFKAVPGWGGWEGPAKPATCYDVEILVEAAKVYRVPVVAESPEHAAFLASDMPLDDVTPEIREYDDVRFLVFAPGDQDNGTVLYDSQ